MNFRISAFFFLIFLCNTATAQEEYVLSGKVTDSETEESVDLAAVYFPEWNIYAETDPSGRFEITLPKADEYYVEVSRIGYQPLNDTLTAPLITLHVKLKPSYTTQDIIITESGIDGMITERVEELKILPSASGNLESILPHIALGTYGGTGGELTSQYNVRGGNYDENLIYINDFEIYRPQLIRSSQQEGLSVANIDLIRDLSFSSGGFEPRYGDKLASVLDIRYKRPDSLRGSLSASLLGASAHVEGSFFRNNKLRYLIGGRYKTTEYLLGSLDVEGEYAPDFTDIQTYITYDLNREWQIGLFGNYNRSIYRFEPVSGQTAFGLLDFTLKLTTFFEGAENDRFINGMGGAFLTWIPDRSHNPLFIKIWGSHYQSLERENIDIIGAYRLSQIETDFTDENFGEEIAVLGTGINHDYVRNVLNTHIGDVNLKAGYEWNLTTSRSHFFQGGIRAKREYIFDKINEWHRLDSAGYNLPYNPTEIHLESVLKSRRDQTSYRYIAYLQDAYTHINPKAEWQLTAGARIGYWTLNEEWIFSPRAQFLYKPLTWKRDISFKISSGTYFQPPFYREMRRPDGTVNKELEAQGSWHLVTGFNWDFYMLNLPKPFRFTAEAYYKKLWDLVSYEIDNVRIRYSGENDAEGHVIGLDLRLNGELVPGEESWITFSLLSAREKLKGVQHLHREQGDSLASAREFVPRPTDQLWRINIFLQDYLPMNKDFKVHLNFTFGSGLPFGLKDNNRIYRNTYRYKGYQRVDIGFSYLLVDREKKRINPHHPLKFARNAWISFEVLNLLQIQNEVSKTWISTIYRTQYAVPNYLTSRRLNIKLRMDF